MDWKIGKTALPSGFDAAASLKQSGRKADWT
jgi:hypothetical protein